MAPIENIDAWQLGNETIKSFSFRKKVEEYFRCDAFVGL